MTATVCTYGDTIHTFVQRNGYKGFFMPGFVAHPYKDPLNQVLPGVSYNYVDHVVGNQPVKSFNFVVDIFQLNYFVFL